MNPLFNRVDIFSVIEQQKQKLKIAFPAITNAELDADPIAVASRLIEEFSINVPVLDEEKKYALTREIQVDVSSDPRRFITDRSRPFYIGGTEVRIVVPFQGDTGVFGVQPTSFSLNPPFGEIKDHELHLVYTLTITIGSRLLLERRRVCTNFGTLSADSPRGSIERRVSP
jgi:hypothetical protein